MAWQRKIRCPTTDGALRDPPEVKLTYHEPIRRKPSVDSRKELYSQRRIRETIEKERMLSNGWCSATDKSIMRRGEESYQTIPKKRTKDCWCSETGSPGKHELISICTYNESQDVLQRKIGCSTADGALRNFSELRLVYHESGGRKLPTERQRNGHFEEKPRRQIVSWRRV